MIRDSQLEKGGEAKEKKVEYSRAIQRKRGSTGKLLGESPSNTTT